jgi:hypothetical protein
MSTQEAVVVVLVVAMVIGLPFMGLTIRFALKPLVDAWLRLREAQLSTPSEVLLLRERVAHLERVLEMHGLVERRLPSLVQPSAPEPLPSGLVNRERV